MMFISKYVYWLEQLFNESLGKISAFVFASDCHHIFFFLFGGYCEGRLQNWATLEK